MLYYEERLQMCEVVKMMFDRNMTNAAGGNVSRKLNDEHYLLTPTLMAQQKFCRLQPEDILVIDENYNIIEGNGGLTREVNMHMGVYKNHPDAKVVIHSHPKESLVYACLGQDMPLVCECVKKLELVKCLDFAPACSMKLANTVIEHINDRKDKDKLPYAMLLREHGILIIDKELKEGYDLLERLETNAYVATMANTIGKYVQQDFDYNLDE